MYSMRTAAGLSKVLQTAHMSIERHTTYMIFYLYSVYVENGTTQKTKEPSTSDTC